MSLQFGNINHFTVKRETDISYTLTDGINDIFLHFNQTPKPLTVGDKVDAFLYFDQKKRLCATLEKPLITTTNPGFVKVVSIMPEMGVFLNIGISKDILLSKDYLGSIKNWPKIGDYVLAILKAKNDTLVARLVNKEDMLDEKNKLTVGQTVLATVTKIVPEGIGLYTDDFNYIFVHRNLLRKEYHIGTKVETEIININDKGDYNGTCIARKELARISDSEMILNYLKKHGSVVNLGNDSTPEEIYAVFKISKSAFKRAVGNLYKQQLITVSNNRISLTEDN